MLLLTPSQFRCRTCRKRKTRCDGKRPKCITCTEHGHECLGYADGGDGRRYIKGLDTPLAAEDIEEYGDQKHTSPVAQIHHGLPTYSNGSPTHLRERHSSLSDINTPKIGQTPRDGNMETGHGSTPMFSDDGTTPSGMAHSMYAGES